MLERGQALAQPLEMIEVYAGRIALRNDLQPSEPLRLEVAP